MPARVLVYYGTDEEHPSTKRAIEALRVNGPSINVKFRFTKDKSYFTDAKLRKYKAVLFLNNTGTILDDTGKAALQNYINSGGNFIGIHYASSALRDTPFYGRQIGAYFASHPPIQELVVEVADATHPSTKLLPARWKLLDEMYNFESDPRAVGARVLLTADECSYSDPEERKFDHATPHPIAWYQEHGAGAGAGYIAGRSWYTGLGHRPEIWTDELFLSHVLGGITWALDSETTRAFDKNAEVGYVSESE